MIAIIHGLDIVASRNYLQDEKQKKKDSISMDGTKVQITDLAQAILGSGLFSDTKTVFIEDFLTGLKKRGGDTKEIIDFIRKNHKTSNILLWESKEVPKRELSIFKDAIINNFRLPQNIFIFLDSLRPNNFRDQIRLFHKTLEQGVKEEMIFFMIQRQFRLLLALSDNTSEKSIDELVRLAPWQKGRLKRQMILFSKDKLKRIYNSIYKIDLGLKTGKLNLSLVQAIDFLLFEI